MFCENCGKRIDDDSKFCEFCGTSVEVQDSPYIECVHCHGLNESDAVFCEFCGKELKAQKRKKSPIIFIIIGLVLLIVLLVFGILFIGNKMDLFEVAIFSSEQDEESDEESDKESERDLDKDASEKEDVKKEVEEPEEPEIDIDGTNEDETVDGLFVYTGNGEGSIELETASNIYAVNEDGDEELLESVETVYLLLEQVDDMVDSQWKASSGHGAAVEGEIYISDGDVFVQVSDFEVTDSDYYDVTEDGINTYSYHIDDCTWTEAQQKAIEMGGTLVHINSVEEYDYILSQIASKGYGKIQFKIGGRRDIDSKEYYWADENNVLYGEVINSQDYWCSSEWMSGEPSYVDGSINETYLQIFYRESEGRWCINDIPNDIVSVVSSYSGNIGYIVEYDD